jgi:biopolymer transport protein ExbD
MAELNTGGDDGGKGGKVRSKKSDSKVDLTAMVDLAFLLITFFMLTTSLSKPQSMDLNLPDKNDTLEDKNKILVDENRTMTLLLGENNKIQCFRGLIESPKFGPKATTYGKEGIRKILLENKVLVNEYSAAQGKPKNGMIVIIKPSKKSNYRNLVDILDEMAIVEVFSSAIVNDITPEEKKLLETK